AIYVERGLDPALADEVAAQLMKHDALGAHMRDEIGITEEMSANPIQAAWASALAFALGAALPLIVAATAPIETLVPAVGLASLASLALLGALSARTGGAPVGRAVARVTLWGALAMAATALIGALVGAAI
ncbi:MAG: VIT1/CCC1 transporter family protein, partial [Pseudomonadota bacterium]